MKITFRTKDGWTPAIQFKGKKEACPLCGGVLSVAPHGGIYCDNVHEYDDQTKKDEVAMTEQANRNRDIIEGIRHRLNSGAITYEEAQAEAQPVLDMMNKRAKELADEYGMKFKPFSFKALMR